MSEIEITPAMINAAIAAARDWLSSASWYEKEDALQNEGLIEKMLSAALSVLNP